MNPNTIVIIILIINALVAIGLIIFGFLQEEGKRSIVIVFGVLTFACPLILPLFLGLFKLFEHLMRNREVDMDDISFDKTREKLVVMPDDEAEMNYVSITDALKLSDLPDLRKLLIDILKYDSASNIGSIAEAINSEDTEASHYAASAIQDALNDFRNNAQRLVTQINNYPDDSTTNIYALEYLYYSLELKILADNEQRSYIYTTNAIAENLFENNKWFMTAEHYSWMIKLMISISDFALAERWIERSITCCPNELETYKSQLRLLYAQGKRAEFLECISRFKKTHIEADEEMLGIIRLYSN